MRYLEDRYYCNSSNNSNHHHFFITLKGIHSRLVSKNKTNKNWKEKKKETVAIGSELTSTFPFCLQELWAMRAASLIWVDEKNIDKAADDCVWWRDEWPPDTSLDLPDSARGWIESDFSRTSSRRPFAGSFHLIDTSAVYRRKLGTDYEVSQQISDRKS